MTTGSAHMSRRIPIALSIGCPGESLALDEDVQSPVLSMVLSMSMSHVWLNRHVVCTTPRLQHRRRVLNTSTLNTAAEYKSNSALV